MQRVRLLYLGLCKLLLLCSPYFIISCLFMVADRLGVCDVNAFFCYHNQANSQVFSRVFFLLTLQ